MVRQEQIYAKALILRILKGQSVIGLSLLSLCVAGVLVGCRGGDEGVNGEQEEGRYMLKTRELAEFSAGAGSVFTSLPATETGVGFSNPIDTSHSLKRLYSLGYAAGGVAIGDLNGDELPDLFFTSGPGENAIYLQRP